MANGVSNSYISHVCSIVKLIVDVNRVACSVVQANRER